VKAKFLSGGQMQRVAIARVLALEPEVLLLDEPFSHIDNFRKNSLRRKLFAYLKSKQITCLIATHDSADVLSFADTVLVMQSGKLLDFDSPKTTFENPKSHYVASLFGDVNEIPKHYFDAQAAPNEMELVYPHQLQIVADSKLQATISNSYFRGSHYLMEATYPEGTLFFESKIDVEIGVKVSLDLKA
jgi:ABC-type sulfate/molybdate transport systems ATPase subunit